MKIKSLESFFNTLKNIEEHKPLSRENAYALSSIGEKHGTYLDVSQAYFKKVLNNIQASAKMFNTYLLQHHPSFVSPSIRKALAEHLEDLGYTICYSNEDIILISWKNSPADYDSSTTI